MTKISRIIEYDIFMGFKSEIKKYIFSILLTWICCFFMYDTMNNFNLYEGISFNYCYGDLIMYNLRGMPKYIPGYEQYTLPIIWILNQVMIAFIAGHYPSRDIYGYGRIILLQSCSRKKWWISKCIWIILSVVIYYIIIFGVSVVFALTHNYSCRLTPDLYVTNILYGIDLSNINISVFMVTLIALPILVSIAFSLFQNTVSFITNPIFGFIAVVILQLISTYFTTPFLLGNYSMVIRNVLCDSTTDIKTSNGIIFSVLFAIAFAVIGGIYFNRKDIIDKR